MKPDFRPAPDEGGSPVQHSSPTVTNGHRLLRLQRNCNATFLEIDFKEVILDAFAEQPVV